jgi:alpha-L-fucosidase
MKPFVLTRREFGKSMLGSAAGSLAPVASFESLPLAAEVEPLSHRGRWFREARFGMFIHFGLYAVLGRGEWVMHTERISISEYEKLLLRFDPSRFNAHAWVDLARAAGQRYITITSKHHEGFCMFDSKLTDYKITRTPFGRDLIGELVAECHRQSLPIFFYYSLMDWHHPAYQESMKSGRAVSPEFIEYLKGHMRELCTNYGPIAGIWFDGGWDHTPEQWHSQELIDIVRQLQPHALVNNRAGLPGDFSTPEQELGARPKEGDESLREACMTINDNWGYAQTDQRFKSPGELIQMLVMAASGDTNLLLNVGPMPTGEIQAEFVIRLKEVGKWMERNGESIYRTRPAYTGYLYDTALTQHENKIYYHIFHWQPGKSLRMDVDVEKPVARAYVLEDGQSIDFVRNPAWASGPSTSFTITTHNHGWGSPDTVIVLETET